LKENNLIDMNKQGLFKKRPCTRIYLIFEDLKMKTIEVNITAEFIVPDDWEVTEHVPDQTFPDDKLTVLKIHNDHYDFFPECLMKVEDSKKVYWSADEGKTEEIIDHMSTFKVRISEK
jgi:hypothetical protein